MSRNLPARFWFETTSAVIGLSLFVLTLFTREWFEVLTGLDPDRGNGALELTLAFGLLAISAASVLLARLDYRRAAAPA
jgi:hypothetical protein